MIEDASTRDVCRVCSSATALRFRAPLLGRDVRYFDCATCGYVQTECPTWLEEAYGSAINAVDTGVLWRNQLNLRRVVMTLLATGGLHGRVVDHAGGYGVLVRLLRDAGVDARWHDPYCQNLMARGFEAKADERCDLVTAFEVFEHFEHPLVELQFLLERAPMVLLSTDIAPPVDSGVEALSQWWYRGGEHGQHIGFFRPATLSWMADRLSCHHHSDGRSLHVFSRDPIPALWLPLVRLHRLAPLVRSLGLKSLMQEDFVRLSRESLSDS